jgi:hypothetical protein
VTTYIVARFRTKRDAERAYRRWNGETAPRGFKVNPEWKAAPLEVHFPGVALKLFPGQVEQYVTIGEGKDRRCEVNPAWEKARYELCYIFGKAEKPRRRRVKR